MYSVRLPVILTASALLTARWAFGEWLMPESEIDGKMGVICVFHQTKAEEKKKKTSTTECSNLLTTLLTAPFN